jgi:hypothetical protein
MILTSVKYDMSRLLRWAAWGCSACAALCLIWAVMQLASTGQERETARVALSKETPKFLFPLDAIGSGPLALHPRLPLGWMSRIADEVAILSFNSRPDAVQKEAKLLVKLKEGVQAVVANGKQLFLQERTEGKGVAFSEDETALWIKPILLDNGNVLMEAGRRLISKEGQLLGEEKGEYVVTLVKGVPQEKSLVYLEELKGARAVGHDALIAKYGGKEYALWRDKVKIEFAPEGRSYACFVGKGDVLQYKDSEWRVVSAEGIDKRLPMARVLTSSPKIVEIEGWDESGFFSVYTKLLNIQQLAPVGTHDLLPTGLRLRSSTQVSCLFGKKRLVIKKGDWVLRTPSGVRNLKRAQEIEDCLFHRLKGELFIFDGIEKQQGKALLQGHLFDILRLQATPVTIPIETEKKPIVGAK